MLVALFRAREDSERTALRLQQMGHEALIAPVLDVVAIGNTMPPGLFDGVIFTSAHGVASLDPASSSCLLDLPCFCVGGRTAELATAFGFDHLHVGRADAERLAALVCSILHGPAALLLVAGRDRKEAIERLLVAAGHKVTVFEAYVARAVDRWPAAVTDAFADGRVQAALHYSRRSTELALRRAAEAGVRKRFLEARHACLSADAAAPLYAIGGVAVALASEPNEDSLLAILDTMPACEE